MHTHLLKRCPGLTLEDRAHIFNEMQRNPGKRLEKQIRNQSIGEQNIHESGADSTQQAIGRVIKAALGLQQPEQSEQREQREQQEQQEQQQKQQEQIDPALGQNLRSAFQQMYTSTQPNPQSYDAETLVLQGQGSALHTLAEVSRRHLDLSTQRASSSDEIQGTTPMRHSERALIEQTFMTAMRQQPHTVQAVNHADESDSFFVDGDFVQHTPSGTHRLRSSEPMASLPLMQTASAANRHLEQNEALTHAHRPSIPQLDSTFNDTSDMTSQTSTGMADTELTMWTSVPQQPFTRRQSPPSTHPLPGFESIPATKRNTNRSRFAEGRRKEVEEIRKLGACIRCRMLKKPCSEGTPCERCQTVKVARLWNFGCLRTRLAGELNLFSTSYFHVRLGRQPAGMQDASFEHLSDRLETKLVKDSTLAMTLKLTQNPFTGLYRLDEGVRLTKKVAEYCANGVTIDTAIEEEQSEFLKTTLDTARRLLETEQQQENSQAKKKDANYIEPSMLLKQVTELWVESAILARSDSLASIALRVNNVTDAQGPEMQTVDWSMNEPSLPATGASYASIKAQLMAALENRVHQLNKSILNEMEQRLLQRRKVSAFATFIAAVIFLNCVERLTAFYQGLDTESSPNSWPLQVTPSELWTHGSHFAQLLIMLLRMRALPPRTLRTERGTLAVIQDHGLLVQPKGVPIGALTTDDKRQAALWLDPMELDVAWLKARRDGLPDPELGGEEAWRQNDMKLISMALLDENM